MIAVGSDHGGFELKNHILKHLEENGLEYEDFGCYDENSVDYPDIAERVCRAINNKECENGILICGTGIGICIAANKINGIRAAHCHDVYSAEMTKRHNNANVICLGGRVIGRELAFKIIDTWLNAEFEGGRHAARIEKIHILEKNND